MGAKSANTMKVITRMMPIVANGLLRAALRKEVAYVDIIQSGGDSKPAEPVESGNTFIALFSDSQQSKVSPLESSLPHTSVR
jgi:hypothetical protein